MALFDLFKKKTTPEPAPVKKTSLSYDNDFRDIKGSEFKSPAAPAKPAAPSTPRPTAPSAPRPAAPSAPRSAAPSAPRPAAPSAPRPTVPSAPRPASPGNPQSGAQRSRNSGYSSQWPKFGSTVEELISGQQRVFVDASFVKSPAFEAFRTAWGRCRVNQYATRYYFIPTSELQKLTAAEQSRIIHADFREFACASTEDCITQLVNKGLNWNILWLTDDSALGIAAQDAAKKSGKVYLRWYGMDETGKLKSLPIAKSVNTPAPAAPAAPKKETNQIFRPTTQSVRISRSRTPVSMVPGRGGAVMASGSGRRISLLAPVMTDHSSITYKTSDPGYFAKIYTAGALSIDLFENKAKRMVQEKIRLEGVCWPEDILTDSRGAFVGILVPASRGVQLSRSLFDGTSGLQQHFPGWDKRDVCAVALTILRTVCALQDMGVYFGCFNPSSVYIESARKVYFVDADTWQIEGYPVISRNITFTPPELLNREEKIHMFTADEENYQTALLAFMLMLPGKYPYAKRNRKTEGDSIRNMSFPFSIGGDLKRSEDAERPTGAWQMVWDHLPYRLCSNFYHSFHQKGNYSTPGTRLRGTVWIDLIEQFEKHLATADGIQSRKLFPETFRRDGKRNFVRCRICGKEHPEFYFLRNVRLQRDRVNVWDKGYRVCLPCAVDRSSSPNARFTCQCCGETYYYTNRTQIMHEIGKLEFDWSNQKWCNTCKKRTVRCSRCRKEVPIYHLKEFVDKTRNQKRTVCGTCFGDLIREEKDRRNMRYTTATCRNCYRSFDITYGDKEHCESKGYSLPTRCPNCRRR